MTSMLATVNSPTDIKNLEFKDLEVLAAEMREVLISVCAANGGHLAPSLGVVEFNHCPASSFYDAPG
jgi:1-deoxy-D-xylulose-5-phosphate synthase